MDDGGPAWADAVIICPWTIYLCYGDRRILENNYATMSRFMEFLVNTSPGYIRCAPEYEGWPGFGDWLSINADTPRDLIGTAFLAYDASLMAQIATILGKTREAADERDERGEPDEGVDEEDGGARDEAARADEGAKADEDEEADEGTARDSDQARSRRSNPVRCW